MTALLHCSPRAKLMLSAKEVTQWTYSRLHALATEVRTFLTKSDPKYCATSQGLARFMLPLRTNGWKRAAASACCWVGQALAAERCALMRRMPIWTTQTLPLVQRQLHPPLPALAQVEPASSSGRKSPDAPKTHANASRTLCIVPAADTAAHAPQKFCARASHCVGRFCRTNSIDTQTMQDGGDSSEIHNQSKGSLR